MAVQLRTGRNIVLGIMRHEKREMHLSEIAQQAGWHGIRTYSNVCSAVGELVRDGMLERVCRGLYRLAPEPITSE